MTGSIVGPASGSSTANGGGLQRQLDTVIAACESNRGGYESALLTARKAQDLVRNIEKELG